MIALSVLSYNGVPAEALTATFDELGGTIGRSDNNQLVLSDPERTISRVHARVVFRASGFAIVDNGSNPIVVNGHPVGSGREHPLKIGDEVQIGGYLLKVSDANAVPASDPFADLFGDAPMGLAGPASTAPAPAPRPAAPPAFPSAPAWPAPPPPSAAWPAPPPPSAAWPAPMAPAAAPWPVSTHTPAPGGTAGASAIPDDWDPFAPERTMVGSGSSGAAVQPPAAAMGNAPLGISGGGGSSIDDMFGLGPASAGAGQDLLAALAAPAAPGPAAPSASATSQGFGFDDAFDPAFDRPRPGRTLSAPERSAGSLPDHVSELNTPMVLPAAAPDTTARVNPTSVPAAAWASLASPSAAPQRPVTIAPVPAPALTDDHASPLAPAPLPSGAILSWQDPPRDGRVVTLPGVFLNDAAGAAPLLPSDSDLGLDFDFDVASAPAAGSPGMEPLVPAAAMGSMAPVLPGGRSPSTSMPRPGAFTGDDPATSITTTPFAKRSAPGPGAPAEPRPAVAASHDAAALQQAFFEGLGVPGLRMADLDEAQMRLIGQLMREAVRGSVELLVARAALKREMRAEMTMIVARENNPLKFSPTVEVALQHLLGTPTPGFMAPATAMRDAFDDLRAHQLGVMAGMRAALEGVLQRFDPQQLEGKLTRKSAIASLIPATRKARLWELFQELFAQLQSEAQDDFDELFGRAFLKAYEDQLDRLHGEPGPR
jgi:predicted component of type VI protein secretion system